MVHPDAFLHPQALVEDGARIGARTRVWAFAHVIAGASIGEDCNLCDHTFVEGGVVVGDRVTLKCGVYLWDGLEVEDDVFIGPSATFTNDARPRSRQPVDRYPITKVSRGASIGANATVLPGITLGRWCMVGAGAVVTRDVPDHALVVGSPARLHSWVCRCGERLEEAADTQVCRCGRRYRERPDGGGLRERSDGD